jgi:dipeptidyl aminopeptidase/acylaminoacyl peptidase
MSLLNSEVAKRPSRYLLRAGLALAFSSFIVSLSNPAWIGQCIRTALLLSRLHTVASVQDRATIDLNFSFPVMRSPNGILLLSKKVRQDSFELIVSSIDGRQTLAQVAVPGNPLELEWNPTADTIAFLADSHGNGRYNILLWSFSQHLLVEQRIDVRNASFPLRWSSDGRRLLFAEGASGNANLEVVDYDGSTLSKPSFVSHIAPQSDYAWSPKAAQIAFVRSDQSSEVVVRSFNNDLRDSTDFDLAGAEVRDLSWSDDGSSLLMRYRGPKDERFSLAMLPLESDQLMICPALEADVVQPRPFGLQVTAILRSRATDRIGRFSDCALQQDGSSFGTGTHLTKIGSDPNQYQVLMRTSDQPASLWTSKPGATLLTQVSSASVVGSPFSDSHVPPEEDVVSVDGRPVQIWLWRPARTTPAKGIVVWLHGGPHLYESPEWNPMYEEMLRRGFFVVVPNYSGSTTFGRSFENEGSLASRARQIVGIAHWAKTQWPGASTHLVLVGSSYGARIVSSVLEIEPKICQRVLYASAIPPLIPNAFDGEIDIFHGTGDSLSPWKTMLWSFADRLQHRPLLDRKVRLFLLPGEGHGITRLRSELALADAATEQEL